MSRPVAVKRINPAMTTSLLIVALIAYVISFVVSVVLLIAASSISARAFLFMAAGHGVLVLAFLVAAAGTGNASRSVCHLTALLACCSGLALAGPAMRIKTAIWLRWYLGLYLLSVPVFLYSPSLLTRLITFHLSAQDPQKFDLVDGLKLERQRAAIGGAGQPPRYKIIRAYGLFYKTLERDLSFGNALDSVRTLHYVPGAELVLRGYVTTAEYPDSIDVVTDLKVDAEQESQIHRGTGNH